MDFFVERERQGAFEKEEGLVGEKRVRLLCRDIRKGWGQGV